MNSKKIKSIKIVEEPTLKYSVNVQDNHNYISSGDILSHNCVIVDEAQNVTMDQMEMIVTRVGLRSKMIICGDDGQVDLKNRSESGFKFLYSKARRIKNIIGITLHQNHRDPIVDELVELYEDFRENTEKKK